MIEGFVAVYVVYCWGAMLVWLCFLHWLFRRLRCKHPTCYEAIGSPSLFWNNSMRNNWLFMKFVWSSRAGDLGDVAVVRAVRFTRVFIVAHILVFFGLSIALILFSL